MMMNTKIKPPIYSKVIWKIQQQLPSIYVKIPSMAVIPICSGRKNNIVQQGTSMYLAGCRVFRSEKLASVWNPPPSMSVVRYLFNFSIRPKGRIEKIL